MILELKGDIFDTEEMCQKIKAAEDDVELVINSPGGDVFSGLQVVKAIENCKHQVTAKVEVMAASIAAIIALSCDKVVLTKNDLMMLHNCWTFTAGNKEQLQQDIDMMDAIDRVLHNIISEHCYDDELLARVDEGDVWLTGDEVAELFDHSELMDVVQDYRLAASASSSPDVSTPAHRTSASGNSPRRERRRENGCGTEGRRGETSSGHCPIKARVM